MNSSNLVRNFKSPSEGTLQIALVICFVGLLILAWSNRFIQDDAFISFRYAYYLAHGQGLVWNPGERIEGYTNFLWTLLMSVPIYLGWEPVKFSFVLGMLCFFGSLLVTYKIGKLLFGNRIPALVSVCLLGTNYTFSSYATGGLETQLQTFLTTTVIWLVAQSFLTNEWKNTRLSLMSLMAGLAVLTRPDSPLLLAVPMSFTLVQLFRNSDSFNQRVSRLASLIIPFSILVGGWLLWKLNYYGELLPNTFQAKVTPSRALSKHGLLYLYLFLESYWLMPLVILFLFYLKRLMERQNVIFALLSLTIVLWLGYIVFVGGDFMEFRFLVPILPALFLLIGWLLFVQIQTRLVSAGLCVAIVLGSLHHAYTFHGWAGIGSTEGLSDYVRETSDSWVGVGKALGEAFNYDPDVSIAVTAAGAVPYYSRLKTIDMFGLSDRWVVRRGATFNVDLPGHQRIATWDYLTERRVNLIVGHPKIVGNDFATATMTDTPDAFGHLKIFGANPYRVAHLLKILEVRLDPEHRLFLGYLSKSNKVDEAIKRNGWRQYDFDPMKGEIKRQPEFPEYTMGTRIEFASTYADKYLWYGFAPAGSPYRWTNRPHAAITFHLNEVVAGTLRINLQPFIVPRQHPRQRVFVNLNGIPVADWELTTQQIQTYTINLPRQMLRQDNVLNFDLPDAESPLTLGVGADTSLLAIDLKWLQIDQGRR